MPSSLTSRRLWAGAALAAAVATGATACGPGSTDASAPPAHSAVPAVTAAAPPTGPAAAPQANPAPAPSGEIRIRPAAPESAAAVPQPVRIQVEGTGIDLEVVPTGVEPNGAMTLPDNHTQAGWYRYGPAPGADAGSSVVAAHVDSRTEQLPIAGLKDTAVGTVLVVTRQDGSVVRYATQGVESISKKSLDEHRLFDRTGEPRLKLVTCGGQWLEAENDYEDNVVLTAAPLS